MRFVRKGLDLALPRRSCACLLGLLAPLLFAGCGKPAPPPILEAEGIVLLDGVPLNHAEVRFIPSIPDAFENIAIGMTDKEGRFKLTCKGEPGACAGENHVLVMEPDIPANLKSEKKQAALIKYLESLGGRPLPKRYASLADNPLLVNVEAGTKVYKFDLKR
jgi:hypothetical protein